MRRFEHAREAERVDPRSVAAARRVGNLQVPLRRYAEARQALDRALAISPSNLLAILNKTMTFLGEGDLAGARATVEPASKNAEPTALVVFVANYQDLGWALTEEQQQLLLRLTPDAFDGDRAAWGICLAQAYAWRGNEANVRVYAEETRKANEEQLREVPNDAQRRAFLGLSLAYLGRKDEAIREGLRAVEILPVSKDAINGPYLSISSPDLHSHGRAGEGDRSAGAGAEDPVLHLARLAEDRPNFDPIRNNPRFQKLVAGAK